MHVVSTQVQAQRGDGLHHHRQSQPSAPETTAEVASHMAYSLRAVVKSSALNKEKGAIWDTGLCHPTHPEPQR